MTTPSRPAPDPFGGNDPFGAGDQSGTSQLGARSQLGASDPFAPTGNADPFGSALPGDPFTGAQGPDPFASTGPGTAVAPGALTPGVDPLAPTPTNAQGARSAAFGRTRKPDHGERPRASKGGWWSIGLVGGGLVVSLVTLYLAFDALDLLSGHPIGSALYWLAACAIGCGVITVGLMVAVVVLARRRPPMLPAIALVVGVVLTPLAFFAVTQIGIDSVLTEARDRAGPVAGQSLAAAAVYAETQGYDLGPLGPILKSFGGS